VYAALPYFHSHSHKLWYGHAALESRPAMPLAAWHIWVMHSQNIYFLGGCGQGSTNRSNLTSQLLGSITTHTGHSTCMHPLNPGWWGSSLVSQGQGSIMTTHSIGNGWRGGVHVKMQGGTVCGCSAPIPPPCSLIVAWSTSPGKQACHAIGLLTHLGHALAKRACLGGLGPRQHQEVHFAKPAPWLHHITHMPQHMYASRKPWLLGQQPDFTGARQHCDNPQHRAGL
jgi:hypothetical protein